MSIIITWIFNNARGSILAAMLAHASYNWSNYLFPTLFNDLGAQIYFILLIILAAAIVLIFGAKRMVHKAEVNPGLPGKE